MGVYQLPSAQKNKVKCRLLLRAGQNVHVQTEMTCLCGALYLMLKSWRDWKGEQVSFQPSSLMNRHNFRFIVGLAFSAFQKAILLVSKEIYLFLPPPECSILQNQVGRKKINLMGSKQKSGFILWVFPSSHSLFFPLMLHVLPVLTTTQTLLSRTSHSAWDNSHVLTRQTFDCGSL